MKKRLLVLFMVMLTMALCAMNVSADTSGTQITSGAGFTISADGNYYLSSDVTLTSSLQISNSGTDVNLYLNGYTLTGNGSDPVIRVNSTGATLNIYDSTTGTTTYYAPYDNTSYELTGGAITGGVGNSSYGGGGIMIYAGTVNMYGGNIVGNTTNSAVSLTYGGGVHIDTGGVFNLYGGSVSGNTSYHHGGGVYVQDGATFNLYGAGTYNSVTTTGGSISYNYKATGSATGGFGAGVYVYGTVNMYGGTIEGNHSNLGGGGLSVVGSFTMTDGTIEGNTSSGAGAGIFVGANATVSMSGDAAITNNKASGHSGGVYLSQDTSTLNMSGNASITGNTANSLGGGVTYQKGTFICLAMQL